ncbi:hypothetical protein ACGFT2_04365 [Streptomyces sp. NPDC048514]|uniref:hypothetical protein n=1 Tax=Streptomyces sp. NPDC048514 TaxID=3365564 RepID=UPI0037161172
MGARSVPRREVVTGRPQASGGTAVPRSAPPPQTPSTARQDGDVREVMRLQLRAALVATALLAALLGLLPVLLRVLPFPDVAASRVPPAVWLLLGVAPYPALLAIGAWYVRRAERNETGTSAPAPGERP